MYAAWTDRRIIPTISVSVLVRHLTECDLTFHISVLGGHARPKCHSMGPGFISSFELRITLQDIKRGHQETAVKSAIIGSFQISL